MPVLVLNRIDSAEYATVLNSGKKKEKPSKNWKFPVIANAQKDPVMEQSNHSLKFETKRGDSSTTWTEANGRLLQMSFSFQNITPTCLEGFKLGRSEEQCEKCCNRSIENVVKDWERSEKIFLGPNYRWIPCTVLLQGKIAGKALNRPIKRPISISSSEKNEATISSKSIDNGKAGGDRVGNSSDRGEGLWCEVVGQVVEYLLVKMVLVRVQGLTLGRRHRCPQWCLRQDFFLMTGKVIFDDLCMW